MKLRCTTCLIFMTTFVAAMMGFSNARAIERTNVGVAFEIANDLPRIRLQYFGKTPNLDELSLMIRDRTVEILNDRIRFLEFSTSTSTEYRLLIRMGPKEQKCDGRANAAVRTAGFEIGFRFCLEGDDLSPDEEVHGYVKFRDKVSYFDPLPSEPERFMAQILLALQNAKYQDLVGGVFSNVVMATEAEFMPFEPVQWWLHKDREIMCLRRGSLLAVENTFPLPGSPPTPTTEEFMARVMEADKPGRTVSMSMPSENHGLDALIRAADPSEVSVERIFVKLYRRSCPAQPTPGDQTSFD